MRMSQEEYDTMMRRRTGGVIDSTPSVPAKRSKHNAVKTKLDGITFDSKLEASYYVHLLTMQKYGEVKHFHRQVIFDLGGGTTYRCDFQVFYKNGDCQYIDVKGFETQAFKRSKKQVEAKYDVEIILVRKGEF